jgi:hypothetical protein
MENNTKKQESKINKPRKKLNLNLNRIFTIIFAVILVLIILFGTTKCKQSDVEPLLDSERPYSDVLVRRLQGSAEANTSPTNIRPDYLPSQMFINLPDMPNDFFQIRQLIRLGRITDFENLEPEYWMQPEFFPYFEEIALPLLQNPPENRWGAYGIAVYPADWVSVVSPGDNLDLYFFIKSGYIVETFQGINLVNIFPESAQMTTGIELPGGIKSVNQNTQMAEEYFDVKITPDLFVLEPNFPIYRINGTIKVKLSINVSENTPSGDYVIALDTAEVPDDYEQAWIREHLNMYTSGGMTKIDRPYYQAFIRVTDGGDN